MSELPKTSQSEQQNLEATALELVEALKNNPCPETAAAVAAFRDQSPTHASEIDRAGRFFDLFDQVDLAPESWWQRRTLDLDLLFARIQERWLGLSSVAILLVSLGVAAVYSKLETDDQPVLTEVKTKAAQTELYSTTWGQQREVTLSDGSTLWLGWRTELEVSIDAEFRHVNLTKGVLALRVASDSTRPFVVYGGGVTATVTGTEFVVTRQINDLIDVSVLEGSVQVQAQAESVALMAEQSVQIEQGRLLQVSPRSSNEIGQWRNGLLVFDERPVAEAIAAVQPYTRLVLDTTDIEDHPGLVTGAFFIDEAETSLGLILSAHELEAVPRGKSLKIRRSLKRQKKK